MRLIKAKKYHKCKKGCDIFPNGYYYPQRCGKAICFEHGYKPKRKSFVCWLLGKLR